MLLLIACAWVSDADVAEKLQEVDDDADGVPAALDCDDRDGARFPGNEEVPYDGVDGDCALDEDYDGDRDGYVATEHAGLATGGVPGTGSLPGGDCDDLLDTVRPGLEDTWYDGVDTNCDGLDDYDHDGDAFVMDAYVGLATTYAAGTGALPGGDCDDAASGIHPGQDDPWYDGVDRDCGGEDDYDQDGDGYVRPGDEGEETQYVAGSGVLPGGDCDDLEAARHPDAVETWYDGVDANCDEANDYDQDADGHDALGWGDDCDDEDAAVLPGALEQLGDLVDSDCDGGVNSFPLTTDLGCTWVSPHEPKFVSDGLKAWLSVAAIELDCSTTYYDSAVALAFDLADPTVVDEVVPWQVSTVDPSAYEATQGHDLVLANGYLFGVLGLDLPRGRAFQLTRYEISARRRTQLSIQDTEVDTPFDDLALALDATGVVHVVGCDATEGVLAYAEVSSIDVGSASFEGTAAGFSAAHCALDPDRGHVLGGGTFSALDVSQEEGALVLTSVPTAVTASLTDLDWDGGDTAWLTDPTGGLLAYDVDLDQTTAVSLPVSPARAVAQVVDGTTWAAGTTSDGGLGLAWGTASVVLSPPILAEDVALYVGGGYVLVGITGADGVAYGLALAP